MPTEQNKVLACLGGKRRCESLVDMQTVNEVEVLMGEYAEQQAEG